MPFPLPDDATIAQLYPSDLKLKMVEIVHRHGERTPAHSMFPQIQEPGMWNRCHLTPFLHAIYAAEGDLENDQEPPSPPRERPPRFNRIVLDPKTHLIEKMQAVAHLKSAIVGGGSREAGGCFQGQLTDKGKATMKEAGENLRKLYIDRLRLFDHQLGKNYHQDVYLRSTDYARTLESLQFLLDGLHPPTSREDEEAAELTIHVKSGKEENMYPNHRCSSLNAAHNEFRKAVARATSKETTDLLARLEHLGTDLSKPHIVQVHALYDIFACMEGHDIPFPKGVTQADMNELEKITTKQWMGLYDESEQQASLAIGRVFKDLKTHIENAVNDSSDCVKLAIFSGHDTTVGPLLCALQAFDKKYPPFASMLNIELFEEASPSRSIWSRIMGKPAPHYVRVLYNGKPVQIPACAPQGKHREGNATMCTLEAFMGQVDRMTPKDYEGSCKTEKFVKFDWMS